MPELPEVETTRRGLAPHLEGRTITGWQIRNPALRWPVELPDDARPQRVTAVDRRAKYLLLKTDRGAFIVHLGMSGRLHFLSSNVAAKPHDHVDFELDNAMVLRLNDPRRFGSVHWHAGDVREHWLLRHLGPEPLGTAFDGDYLWRVSRTRRVAIKNLLMDARIVVGVGNIYANEALFLAGIRPGIASGRLSQPACRCLAGAVREVLQRALAAGGTTFRDFLDADGQPGYFVQSLNVYGREGLPCRVCREALVGVRKANRATVFCRNCQTARGNRDYCW